MVAQSLRQRLKSREQMTCIFMATKSPDLIEMAGLAGFDFVIVDAQHGPISAGDLPDLMRAGQSAGIPALVRVPALDKAFILQALEAGAAGVMAPEIETAQQAQELVELTRYAPAGRRSVGAYARAQMYSRKREFSELRAADAETIVAVNIETKLGIENAEAIMSTEGIDLVITGMIDLRMALAGSPEGELMLNSLSAELGEIAKRLGVSITRSASHGNIASTEVYTLLTDALNRFIDELGN
jgi:2-keto-3-deoxy-L-rhamnonate aldolase RhmA